MAAIHVLEHFYKWEVASILREWRRILKPGGKLILELPCMNKVADYMGWAALYKIDMLDFMSMHSLYGDDKHEDPAMCHKWAWFKDPLENLLKDVGFAEVNFVEPRYHFLFRDQRFECVK